MGGGGGGGWGGGVDSAVGVGNAGVMSCEGMVPVGVGAATSAQPTMNSVNTQSKSDIVLIVSFILFSFTIVSHRSIPCLHSMP